MFYLKSLLPEKADNNYQGHVIAFYFFILLTVFMTIRSLIHMFLDDSGIGLIAGIISFDGNPDPDNVIYLFGSLWGFQQAIFCFLCIIVLLKYRSLIPLMSGLFLFEWTVRLIIYPEWRGLGTEYYADSAMTTGISGAQFVTAALLAMFLFTLKRSK